jgi:hypothetical protein
MHQNLFQNKRCYLTDKTTNRFSIKSLKHFLNFSISSGKSMMSNFSVKSDSGINLPIAAGKQPQQSQTAPLPPPQSVATVGRKSETKRNILVS